MELADVTDSKSVGSNTVWVRVPPPAPNTEAPVGCLCVWLSRTGLEAGGTKRSCGAFCPVGERKQSGRAARSASKGRFERRVPPPGAARLLSCKLYRSLISEVVAHSRKRLRGSAHSVGNVPDAWIFSFQGSLSRKALRKLNLRIPCGEICPLTFQWTFFCPLSGITQNIFLLFCGSVRLRHARSAWSCCAPQHMRTGFSPR